MDADKENYQIALSDFDVFDKGFQEILAPLSNLKKELEGAGIFYKE